MNDNNSGLSPDQQRYLELTKRCGLTFDEAMHALGRRRGSAPDYVRLTHNEKMREIDRLKGNGLTLIEARRVVGLDTQKLEFASKCPAKTLSDKAQKRADKREAVRAKYHQALARPDLKGFKGIRK